MTTRHATCNRSRWAIVLAMLVFIGAVRVGVTLVDEFLPGQHAPVQSTDSVAVRRSLQLVTVSLEALAVCVGLAHSAASGPQTTRVPPGAFHLA